MTKAPRPIQRRKPIASKKKKSKKPVGKRRHFMPNWMRNLLTFIIICTFSAGFYFFFIKPYAYRWKPCPNKKEYGVCIPCGYEVHGLDISHYQGIIDWKLLKLNQENDFPLHFVFMKATEGGDHSDDTFHRNFNDARRYGFIRGAYHYFIPNTDALKQANFFIKTVKLDSGDLPPVLDVETTGRRSKKDLQRDLKRWLNRVESYYGVKPILYTSYKFKLNYLDDPAFNAYPYWIAHYYVDSVKYQGRWAFWQHTDVGTVSGIDQDVDLNVFNGSLDDLLKMTVKPKKGRLAH